MDASDSDIIQRPTVGRSVETEDVLEYIRTNKVKAVGFDMDGVLFGTSMVKSMGQIGVRHALSYIWHIGKPPRRNDYFDSLRVPQLERDTKGHDVEHFGIKMPTILTCWQCGYEAGAVIEEDINNYYDSDDCKLKDCEKDIFREIAHLMLNPEKFVASRKVLNDGQELLTRIRTELPDVLCFSVTNWDFPSFALLKAKFPHVFEQLQFVVISGEVHTVKPHPEIFGIALEKVLEINPDIDGSHCLFIDDELANAIGAGVAGLKGWHYSV